MTSSTESPASAEPVWRARLAKVVEQDPLIVSRPSRAAASALADPPRTVFMGVGLCTRNELSAALPLDLLGMVLPAEAVRRAIDAAQLLILVADAHAMTNHLSREGIERRARLTVHALARLSRRLGFPHMAILRASVLEQQDDFQRTLREVRNEAGDQHHPYVVQQVADVACLSRKFGGLVKFGWTLGTGYHPSGVTDEITFDRLVAPLSGVRAGYVYGWPGRTFDDSRGRAPPYIVRQPAKRVLLAGSEDVVGKIETAKVGASNGTVRAVRNHLRRLTAGYTRLVGPLRGGSVEERAQAMLDDIYRPPSSL